MAGGMLVSVCLSMHVCMCVCEAVQERVMSEGVYVRGGVGVKDS